HRLRLGQKADNDAEYLVAAADLHYSARREAGRRAGPVARWTHLTDGSPVRGRLQRQPKRGFPDTEGMAALRSVSRAVCSRSGAVTGAGPAHSDRVVLTLLRGSGKAAGSPHLPDHPGSRRATRRIHLLTGARGPGTRPRRGGYGQRRRGGADLLGT